MIFKSVQFGRFRVRRTILARKHFLYYQKNNHCNQNIAVISGALFTFQIQYEYAQCDEGARDVNNIWVTAVTFTRTFSISRELSLK